MTNAGHRKGKFIAVANMKGGVGKTTMVVSLAEALAADDDTKKILVVDLDPQASASVAIAGDEQLDGLIATERTFEALLEQKIVIKTSVDIKKLIHPTICATFHRNKQLNVALLPCGPKLRWVERELIYELARADYSLTSADGQITRLFKSELMPLSAIYDYIIYDCAPGISPVTEIAIRLSDLVVVPTIPDRLSVYGLNAFYEGIWGAGNRSLPSPKSPPCVLVVRKDQRIAQHRDVHMSLQKGSRERDAGYRMFDHQIPSSAALVEALMKNEDGLTFTQKYTHKVVTEILNPLVREVKGML